MTYTVKGLADLSGVSIRTLRFYDQIGLLKPARVAENGYRHYGQDQLLRLQQILFYRELGFALKEIHGLLGSRDLAPALEKHRQALKLERERIRKLLQTVDRTISKLKGERKMKDEELFSGFDPEKQAEYEKRIETRFGAGSPALAESRKNTGEWTKAEWEKSARNWDTILDDLAKAMRARRPAGSAHVQAIVRRHYEWLCRFWTPSRQSYSGHAMGYTSPEWSQAFRARDPGHPKLAEYLCEGMRRFAETELS